MERREFFALVRSIAEHLPDEWRYNPNAEHSRHGRGHAEIVGAYGRALHFRERWETQDAVRVSGG